MEHKKSTTSKILPMMLTLNFYFLKFYKTQMVKEKKDYFIRFRIDNTEKKRVERLSQITRRATSDLYREAMYQLLKSHHPEVI